MMEKTVEKYLKNYRVLPIDELYALIEQHSLAPDSFSEGANIALQQIISERNIRIADVLETRIKERQSGTGSDVSGSRLASKAYGKIIGVLGLASALLVGGVSVYQGHIGGLITASITAICSLWLIFKFEGD